MQHSQRYQCGRGLTREFGLSGDAAGLAPTIEILLLPGFLTCTECSWDSHGTA